MIFDLLPRRIAIFLSISMIVGGLVLGLWSYAQIPWSQTAAGHAPVVLTREKTSATISLSPTPTPVAQQPVVLGIDADLPAPVHTAVEQVVLSATQVYTAPTTALSVTVRLESAGGDVPIYHTVFAAAARFDTIHPAIAAADLQALWQGTPAETAFYQQVAILEETQPLLVDLLGDAAASVTAYPTLDELIDAVWLDRATVALLPFDLLVPELTVLAVDGVNPIDNRFDAAAYPLIHAIDAHPVQPVAAHETVLEQIRSESGGTNRRADRLTVVAMTGVTAMVRQTAAQMDRYGPAWPAEVVGPELAAADITAISNEVPFVPGCETNTDPNNLTFCSPPDYMATLEAVGADVIGLTGNHQNDYGRADALASLDIYSEAGLPVYGGGRNKTEAFAPLYVEHNGNRLAFLGANSYGPPIAWATDDAPGSAEFDLNIMSATIRNIKEDDRADVVLAELQYQESYDVQPLFDQRQNFRALARAGADIVTGVQSHVPQAVEFEEGRLILYGLGNLFFDQMWTQPTREGLIVKHTIYQGRHISTQVLTTLLYDYGQPRWTTDAEREAILRRVFDASYWARPRQ